MSTKNCYNCKYASEKFRVSGMTHVHCQKPEYEEQAKAGNPPSAWETLRAWWSKCKQFESKKAQL